MRPIELRVRAFGPYANEQVFDFRELGNRSFFLIHGPTGSGKSSILDAVCFALYGETSGGEREARHMRSDYASAETLTEVSFDFSLGDRVYRVTRSPEQERAKARGSGTTTQRPIATLWDRTGVTDDSEEGVVLAGQWLKVTEHMERLLGFQSDQFRQVVMLPQGQFREFLLADSRERQMILEVLFQTEVYRRIEEALKEVAKDVQRQFEDLKRRKQIILEHAAVESDRQLEEARDSLSARLAALTVQIEAHRQREKQANEALDRGRDTRRKLDEEKQAKAALGALESRKKDVEADRTRLDRAGKASGLGDVEANLAGRRKEFQEVSVKLQETQKRQESASKAKEAADAAFSREQDREGEREDARRRLVQLKAMADQVREVEEARSSLKASSFRALRIGQIHERKEALLDKWRDALAKVGAEHRDAGAVAVHLERYRLELDQACQSYRKAIRLKTGQKHLDAALENQGKANRALEGAQRDLDLARSRLDAVEKSWFEGQAANLARGLRDGSPCPVCGSMEHPAPAHYEKDLPTETALRKSRKEARDSEAAYERARKTSERANLDVAAVQSEVKNLEKEPGAAGAPDAAGLKLLVKAAAGQVRAALSAEVQAGKLAGRVGILEDEVRRTQERVKRLESGLQAAVRRRDAEAAVLGEREAKIPAELREAGALGTAVKASEKRLKSLMDALEAARRKNEVTEQELAACRESMLGAHRAVDVANAHVKEATESFEFRLKTAGFEDTKDYQSAKLERKEIDRLDRAIRDYHERLKAALDRSERAAEAARNLGEPDLAGLEKNLGEAKAVLQSAIADRGALQAQAGQLDRWIKELQRLAAGMETFEKQYAVMGRISDVANGRNAQGLTFERFVLAALLDDVLDAASRRLRRMSKGRFDLQRSRERAGQRGAAGLDLLVYDTYTGTTRPVNTLSGGESFLASLSMALGLADVVQAYAGGIRLDTIFIDEGFGSLDPESLDLAFQTLVELQEGNRLVGVISHVPELKERIDVRLEVIPGTRGSTARFVV